MHSHATDVVAHSKESTVYQHHYVMSELVKDRQATFQSEASNYRLAKLANANKPRRRWLSLARRRSAITPIVSLKPPVPTSSVPPPLGV